MGRIVKGIFIPMEIWQSKELSWNEKVLLMEIDSFTCKGEECYFSNSFIGELLGVKEDTASGLIQSLIRKGYIRQTRFDGRRRYVETCIEIRWGVGEKSDTDSDENPMQTRTDVRCRLGEKSEENKYINKPSTIPPFIPPTNKMVVEYARGRGFVDPEGFAEHFLAYYSEGEHPWHLSNGKPMKDWKRAVITWETNNKSRRFSASNQPQQPQQATSEAFQKFMR